MSSIVFIVLAALLSGAALFVVAYPVLTRTGAAQPETSTASESLQELLAQRDAALQALRELSFDRQVGKITEEDFVVFEANLKRTAADRLRALDEWEAQSDKVLDRLLERAVTVRRESLQADGRTCPRCGRRAATEDKFCAGCGASLPAAQAVNAANECPKCGRPHEPGDRFCAGCGGPL